MYSGQRDGVPYFIHYTATEDQSYTMAVGLDKLENGTMTTVYTPQSINGRSLKLRSERRRTLGRGISAGQHCNL